MKEFSKSDDQYLAWLRQNPSGFVMNTDRVPQPGYIVLHHASCHTIWPNSSYRKGEFVEGKYIKICAKTIQELGSWVTKKKLRDGSFSKECSKCKPRDSSRHTAVLLGVRAQEDLERDFESSVRKAKSLRPDERRKLLPPAGFRPSTVMVVSSVHIRNSMVVVEVLNRSHGHCEQCMEKAPFKRKSDGSPYLEVHHKVRLADDGEDTVENAIALCPNCHRKLHFGQLDTASAAAETTVIKD